MSRKGRRAKSKKRPSLAPQAGVGGGLSAEASVEEEQEEAATVSSEPPPAEPAGAIAKAEPTSAPPPEQAAAPQPAAAADDTTPGALTTTQPSASEKAPPAGAAVEEIGPPSAELDHQFFAPRPVHVDLLPEPERPDPRIAHRHSVEAMERRKHFAKYVKIAVGLAAAVCLAAAGKVMLVHDAPGTEARAEERHPPAVIAPSEPPAAPAVSSAPAPTIVQAAEPSPAPQASQEPAAPSASAAAVASAPSATSDPAPSAAASAAEPPELDPKAAAKAKNASRSALEGGRLAAAIASGEKSVSLDPTDAEAWLLLGAAYQEKGDLKNARRCYKSCLEEGKRGNKSECAAMLR
jgi:hypothetical protein